MINRIKTVIPFIVIAIVIYYLATRVNWVTTLATLKTISPFTLVISVALNILSAATMSTAHFSFIANETEKKSIFTVESINARVLGYSTVLPAAVVAAYKIAAFTNIFKSASKAIVFFAVGKICSLLVALMVLLYIGYTSAIFSKLSQSSFGSPYFLGSVALLLFSGIVVITIQPIRKLIFSIVKRFLPSRFTNALASTKSVIGITAWSSGVFTQSMAFTLTTYAGTIIATAINPNFPLEAIFIGRAITLIALLAPISVAGVGAREISFLAILPLYGVTTNDTAALVLLLLLTQWFAGLFGMGYALALTKIFGKTA